MSKSSKRGNSSLSKKKRNSRANSLRREEIMKQYLGTAIKRDNFLTFASPKSIKGNRLNKSFNFPKSTKGTKVSTTPQLKKLLTINNQNMNKSQRSDLSMKPKRNSLQSPIHFGKPKIEKKPIIFKVIKSLKSQEACENNKVADYDEDTNIVTKFAFATRVGYQPSNPGKVNQDAFILAPNILNRQSMHYFGVCDGHGQYGKDVSSIIKQKLPALLEENLYTATKATKNSIRSSTDKLLDEALLPSQCLIK